MSAAVLQSRIKSLQIQLDILKSQIESEIKSEVETRSFSDMYGILSHIVTSSEKEIENSQYTASFND